MDVAFTHKAQTSNYLKRTYLQQRETPPAHKLTSWQGMELSLEGAPLSHLSLEASASLQQALSRRRLPMRVSSSCQIVTWCRLISRVGKLFVDKSRGAKRLTKSPILIWYGTDELFILRVTASTNNSIFAPLKVILSYNFVLGGGIYSAMITIGVSFSLT